MLAIKDAIYFIIIITQEPTLRYLRAAQLQALYPHWNLFTGLLYTYTQGPTPVILVNLCLG